MDLNHLIEHPPRDPEPSANPAFTTAVMGRVRAAAAPVDVPTAPTRWWWLAAAGIALGVGVLPLDLSLPDVATGFLDPMILGEVLLVAVIAAALVLQPQRRTA